MDQQVPANARPGQKLEIQPLEYEPDMQVASRYLPVFTPKLALQRYQIVKDLIDEIFHDGLDFGKIPGTDKPSLWKPGAEKLCTFFGLVPEYEYEEVIEDWGRDGREPLFAYRIKCRLNRDGYKIGEGMGFASTWESKYRYRWVDEDTASKIADITKAVRRDGSRVVFEPEWAVDKAEVNPKYGKTLEYWAAFKGAINSGTAISKTKEFGKEKKKTKGWEITLGQIQFRVPNPDFADQINTVLKMCMKRALIAAVLVALNISDRFTQDVEDFVDIDYAYNDKPKADPIPEQQQADPERKPEKVNTDSAPEPFRKAEAQAIDPALSAAFCRIAKKEGKQVIADFFADLIETAGQDEAAKQYTELLQRHGLNDKLEFKKIGEVKAFVADLFTIVQSFQPTGGAQ